MFLLEKEQKVYDVSGVKIGGQPGVNPTVLIGSVFYQGHKVLTDEKTGEFDRKKAEALINNAEEVSEKYGNPLMLDVVGPSGIILEKHIDFVSEISTVPFLIDGATQEARIAAVGHVTEVGLHERAIFNSINQNTKPSETDALKGSKVKSAIVFTFNLRNPTIEGRLSLIRGETGRSLLSIAEESGIEKILVDTCLLDPPDLGPATKAVLLAKSELGYPAGCGSGNAIDQWTRAKALDKTTRKICIGSSLAFQSIGWR